MDIDDYPENTGSYRREVLKHLRAVDDVGRRMVDVERDVTNLGRDVKQIQHVLYGNPDEKSLVKGQRGGLVDLCRDLNTGLEKVSRLPLLIKLLIGANLLVFIRSIPWKSVVSFFP